MVKNPTFIASSTASTIGCDKSMYFTSGTEPDGSFVVLI
jgi:hypothetical protein